MSRYRISRDSDGVRVEGVTRHVFIRNGADYHLTDLLIFADGLIDCWGPTDLAGLREQLESGWVATSIEEGAWAFADGVGYWRFGTAGSSVDAEMLLGEVADEIDRLNDRPDSIERCRRALSVFLADRTEANRELLLRRYREIPEHFRGHALGDMDEKDRPLRVLATPVGRRTGHPDDDEPVTVQTHESALRYFADREFEAAESARREPADGPETPRSATVSVPCTIHPDGWPDTLGVEALHNNCPAAVDVHGRRYPSVEHAYWALSTPDESVRAQIADTANPFQAKELAEAAPRAQSWPEVRQAVMTRLLRTRYTRHPKLGELLLSTGDAQILYTSPHSGYWGSQGHNWVGRLLELVRSELALDRAGPRFGASRVCAPGTSGAVPRHPR